MAVPELEALQSCFSDPKASPLKRGLGPWGLGFGVSGFRRDQILLGFEVQGRV